MSSSRECNPGLFKRRVNKNPLVFIETLTPRSFPFLIVHQRALETLYSPVLSELQDTILSYHQHNSLSTSKRSSFYSTQETFFLPGEEDNRDSSNDREELSQDFPSGEGSRIGAAVLAGKKCLSGHPPLSSSPLLLLFPPSFFPEPQAQLLSLNSSSQSYLRPFQLLQNRVIIPKLF